MRESIRVSLLSTMLVGCSSGYVYFGAGDQRQTSDAYFPPNANLTLTTLLPELSTATHEYFIEKSPTPKTFLAVPRTLNAAVYVLTSSDQITPYYGDEHALFSRCFEIIAYAISEAPSSENSLLKLERIPEYRNGECSPLEQLSWQGLPDKTELQEDLKANTARLLVAGSPVFQKSATINAGWQTLTRDGGPPKLYAPTAFPTDDGFLLWGKNIDSETLYGSLYRHNEKTWTPLFGMEHAPASDSVLSHTWDQGVLYVVAKSGLFLFDTARSTWLPPAEGADPIWPLAVRSAWSVKGDDSFLLIARTGEDGSDQIDTFYLFSRAKGWQEVLSRQAGDLYGQPVWDGKAYILWTPVAAKTEFLYPERPEDLTAIASGVQSAWGFNDVRRIGNETIGTFTSFNDNQASRTARLARNHSGWIETEPSAPIRRGSVFAAALSGDWYVNFGGIEQGLENDNAANFYNSDWSHIIRMPATDEIETTMIPAVAWSRNRLFVWGGCKQFSNSQCVSHSSTGYVLNTYIRP